MKALRKMVWSPCLVLFFSTGSYSQTVDFSFKNEQLPIEQRAEMLVSQMTLEEQIGQLVNAAEALPRFDIPAYDWWNEALHGVARNGKATIFPQAIGLAATFDPQLAQRVGDAIATEARAKFALSQQLGNYSKYAGLTFWTPNINIFRDPRWGRGQETYGEDPFLTSQMGIAFVKGLQGDNPQYLKTAACAKHFAVHSGPESLRHHFNAEPSPQDLYETYLPAFEALVTQAHVEGVMAAYNAVYGEPSGSSTFLLQDLLRKRWQFKGYIVSDCGAVNGIWENHKKAASPEEAAALALKAGMNLNCGTTFESLTKAVAEGLVSEQLIHDRTRELLMTRFRLGLMDAHPDKNPYVHADPEEIHSQAHKDLAREVAQKSIVLLKNENHTLPLSKTIKIPYLTGPFANSADMLMGNYYGVSSDLVTLLEGITDKMAPGTSLNYRSGALPFQKNLNPLNWAPFEAGESDVTICVVGITADMEGEEVDAIAAEHNGDREDLKLPQNQIDYIHQIAEKIKGPLVLVIASGSPVSLEGIYEYCDAILQIWYPGEQGGNAVADVLFGDVSPSGHLPITFPKNVEQLPPFETYSMQGRTYKYMKEEPLFPFGFGLTYSKTELSNLRVSSQVFRPNQSLEVKVTVQNTGDCRMEDVIQLYLLPEENTENLPQASLKAFQRVALEKGERKELTFSINSENLKVVNVKGERVWRKGNYRVVAGNASPGAVSVKLGAATPVETRISLK